jgi:hypothetical protein
MRPDPPWHAPLSRRLTRVRPGVPTLVLCGAVCLAALLYGRHGQATLAERAARLSTATASTLSRGTRPGQVVSAATVSDSRPAATPLRDDDQPRDFHGEQPGRDGREFSFGRR